MARVWEASDEVLRRQVAVKVLHPHLGADESFVRRFRQEAVAAARLGHPGIVSIFDTCSDPGLEAIVMELLPGRTLRDRLDEDPPVDPWQAAGLAAQVAEALAAAHRAGLVHRDIKPANILLAEGGRVKVADFGIAKAVADADLTQPGSVVGTAKYLAPEQVTGGTVDARTDVYALGTVLYEMLCGRPPFTGDSDSAVALARLHRDPLSPRQVRPGVPRGLEAVTMRALARQPGDRYPSATDLRAALLAAGADAEPESPGRAPSGFGSPPEPTALGSAPWANAAPIPTFARSERSWLVPTLLAVTAAVALGVAGLLLGRSGAGTFLDDVRSSLGAGAAATVTSASAFDPDGDLHENDGDALLAIDGDPATAWITEGYDDRDVTRLKAGVGIVLRLSEEQRLDRLVLRSPTANWRARVYVAARPAAEARGMG